MNPRQVSLWPIFLVSLNVLVLFFGGVYLYKRSSPTLPADALQILGLVHRQILAEHVEDHDPSELVEEAIRAMVHGLDRHSRFVSAEEVKSFEASEITGTYEGIGILIVSGVSPATIRFPISGGPAEAAGLEAGDKILAVNGEDIHAVAPEKIIETAIRLIKGPANSMVQLTIERDGKPPFQVDVDRADVRQPAVKWARIVDREKGLGYLHIADFQQGMVEQFDRAIDRLQTETGDPLKGLIIDLRYNGGGLLDEAIALSNRFVAKGSIVSLKRRNDEIVEQHDADPKLCTLAGLPVVILINSGTASASEVVSGCLQDYEIAKLVGVRSHGKGVVQSIYQWGELPFRLKLTTAHYYTPRGRSVEARMRRKGDKDAKGGLDPDREIKIDARANQQIGAALDQIEVSPRHAAAAAALAKTLNIELPHPTPLDQDSQLQGAIEELRSMLSGVKARDKTAKTTDKVPEITGKDTKGR